MNIHRVKDRLHRCVEFTDENSESLFVVCDKIIAVATLPKVFTVAPTTVAAASFALLTEFEHCTRIPVAGEDEWVFEVFLRLQLLLVICALDWSQRALHTTQTFVLLTGTKVPYIQHRQTNQHVHSFTQS